MSEIHYGVNGNGFWLPDVFAEHKDLINHAELPEVARDYKNTSIFELPGLEQALRVLEAQRKQHPGALAGRQQLSISVVFPCAGDVGRSGLESNLASVQHASQNGVNHSNGNRAIRHLGVLTVSVPMGVMANKRGCR